MKLVHVKGNTYYFDSELLIPIYKVSETECILIDNGWTYQREELENSLIENGLKPVGILGTHTHVDHSANTGYFMEKYNISCAMSVGEIGLGYTKLNLKALYYPWTPNGIIEDPRFGDMVCQPDVFIYPDQNEITMCGATFGIVRTPGHTPDHIAFVTPDDIMCLGDALLTGEEITNSKIPFFFAIVDALKTMDKIAKTDHAGYIVVHKGFYEDITEQVEICKRELLDRCEKIRQVIDHPMGYDEVHREVCHKLNIRSQKMTNYLVFERNIKTFLDYLVDTNQLEMFIDDSMKFYRQV